jgi:NAD(P)H-hydrate repair Nnr-like enzyme with NAD(P)H-hydrate dehydratase domain
LQCKLQIPASICTLAGSSAACSAEEIFEEIAESFPKRSEVHIFKAAESRAATGAASLNTLLAGRSGSGNNTIISTDLPLEV